MANADKGKYVVLFNSGNFVFFKHKNDKVCAEFAERDS